MCPSCTVQYCTDTAVLYPQVDGKSVSIRSCGEAALCPALQKGCHKQDDAETDGYNFIHLSIYLFIIYLHIYISRYTIKHNKVCCCLGEL